jgi:Na+/melibiose symporter-like transporter
MDVYFNSSINCLIIPFILFERKLSLLSKNMSYAKNSERHLTIPNPNSKLTPPIIPLSLFKDRNFTLGTAIIILFYIGIPLVGFVFPFYLQSGLALSPLATSVIFFPLGIGLLVSSLLTIKITSRRKVFIMKIGVILDLICYALLITAAYQQSSIGLQLSQLLPFMFAIGIGNGLVLIPLINIIISRAKPEDAGAASGVLNTMIGVGNALGIALIGSMFFGMIGTATPATSHTGNHTNESNSNLNYQVRIRHYDDALVNSTLYTISIITVTLFLIFYLSSIHSRITL